MSSESLDLVEYCELRFEDSPCSGTVMSVGKGADGSGLWLARALLPKVALVGVVASSRCIGGGWMFGAVLGRGVVGVVSSPLWPMASGARAVFTGRKAVIAGGGRERLSDGRSVEEEAGVRSPCRSGGGSQVVGRVGYGRLGRWTRRLDHRIKTHGMMISCSYGRSDPV